MEMAVTTAEMEGLNRGAEDVEDEEHKEEPKGKENGLVSAVKAGEEVMMVKEMREDSGEENTSL